MNEILIVTLYPLGINQFTIADLIQALINSEGPCSGQVIIYSFIDIRTTFTFYTF